jgi:hypothetical protein
LFAALNYCLLIHIPLQKLKQAAIELAVAAAVEAALAAVKLPATVMVVMAQIVVQIPFLL